jgi:hypothetical protein
MSSTTICHGCLCSFRPLPSPVNPDVLSIELQGYDVSKKDRLLQGFKFDFKLGIDQQSRQAKNPNSTLQNSDIVGIIAVFSDTTSIFIVDMACAMSGATEKWLVFIVHCSVANVARVLSKFGRLHIYSLPLYHCIFSWQFS